MTTSANNGRRDFVKVAGFGALAAGIAKTGSVFAQGKDEVKIGVIGCGGRGSGAARNAVEADPQRVKIVALGDLFADRMSDIKSYLGQDDKKKNNGLTPDSCYFGMDAFKKVLTHELDYVILATHLTFDRCTLRPPSKPAKTSSPKSPSPLIQLACGCSWTPAKRLRKKVCA